jgi:hypothetical protein
MEPKLVNSTSTEERRLIRLDQPKPMLLCEDIA